MHVYRLSSALALTALVVAAACSDNTSPTLSNFYANATGDQEVPAVASTATGQATITNFTGTAVPAVKLTWSSGFTPTRVTIQSGAGTANGAALADVCGGAAAACTNAGTTNAVMLSGNSTTSLYTSMKTNGGTYVNFYSAAHPPSGATGNVTGGEIRGALVYTPATP